MKNLEFFIKKCEKDLVVLRDISESTLQLFYRLSEKDKVLCKPILYFVGRLKNSIEMKVSIEKFEFLPKERILVCRLIPLAMSFDKDIPNWSGYLLTRAIEDATKINGIKSSEILIAILEIFCEFRTPLSHYVYNFCSALSAQLFFYDREQFHNIEISNLWNNNCHEAVESVALLRLWFTDTTNKPKVLLEYMILLIQNKKFVNIFVRYRDYFDDLEYKQRFIRHLNDSRLPKTEEELILQIVNLE